MFKEFSAYLLLGCLIFSHAYGLEDYLLDNNPDFDGAQLYCRAKVREFTQENPEAADIYKELSRCFSSSQTSTLNFYKPLLLKLRDLGLEQKKEILPVSSQQDATRASKCSYASITSSDEAQKLGEFIEAFGVALEAAKEDPASINRFFSAFVLTEEQHSSTEEPAYAPSAVSCYKLSDLTPDNYIQAGREIARDLAVRGIEINLLHEKVITPLCMKFREFGREYDIHLVDPYITYLPKLICISENLGLIDAFLSVEQVIAEIKSYFGNVPFFNLARKNGSKEKLSTQDFLTEVTFFFKGFYPNEVFLKLASGAWSLAIEIDKLENPSTKVKKTKGLSEVALAVLRTHVSRKDSCVAETLPERVNRLFVAFIETLHYKLSMPK
ncbi:MAG: hypothetical protein JSS34_06580 [Proteobacteria bacterium]|nr:hypothetical protein [Pseudomonadota bacterium]